MKIILRFIIFIATVVGVLAIIAGGIFMGTGNLDFLQSIGISPEFGTLQTAPGSAPSASETSTEAGTTMLLSFTWRGDEIIYNETAISETDFADLLAQAKASDAKVEILKFSDVRVEAADRWRVLLDEAGVRYEVIPQE